MHKYTPILNNKKGFSLVEIMVVLAIIAAITANFARMMGKSNRQIRNEVRYFSGLIRDVRNKARLRDQTYRLVILMPKDKDQKQQYWVEKTQGDGLVSYDDDAIDNMQSPSDDPEEAARTSGGFQKAEEFEDKGPELPKPLRFKAVDVVNLERRFETGQVYIHFFPEGRVEESIIHITAGEELEWSLAVHPLTGKVEMLGGDVEVDDLKQD